MAALSRGSNLKVSDIGHQKAFDYMVYGSAQGWFAAVNGHEIQLYSSKNFQIFLSFKITEEQSKKGSDLLQ